MYAEKYLCVQLRKKWAKPKIRLTSSIPTLSPNEVAIKLYIDIPDELFEKPTLKANITVPKDAVTPAILDADVKDNIIEQVGKQLGVELSISLIDERGEKHDIEN